MSSREIEKSLPRRYTRFDAKKQRAFLKNLELTGNLEASARAVDVSPQAIYAKMKSTPLFKVAVEKARDIVVTEAEKELRRRAIDGVEKGIYFKGELVATEKQYSDVLLMELLKANAPEKYGSKTATINVNHTHVIENRAKDKLATLLGVDIVDAEFTDASSPQALAQAP